MKNLLMLLVLPLALLVSCSEKYESEYKGNDQNNNEEIIDPADDLTSSRRIVPPNTPKGDMIWDFWTWNVVVTVTDADGADLLEDIMPGELSAAYNGEDYPLSEDTRTRFLMPRWSGLIKGHDSATGLNTVVFGEFTPEDNYKNEPFTLNLQDGTSVEITFDCYITWKRHTQPIVRTSAKVNGEYGSWTNPYTGAGMVISAFMRTAW